MPTFFNPYAFVPARSRPPGPDSAWGDGPAAAQGILREGCWSGRLRLRITGVTPLLISEQTRHGDTTHRATRVIDGTVVLTPTSVKGTLRSEYEMLTGSRFGVFDRHGRMGHRIAAALPDAKDLLPVRIVKHTDGSTRALPCRGFADDALPAAWVPCYAGPIVSLPEGLRSGDPVHAWVIKMRREIWHKDRWKPTFRYWRVVDLATEKRPAPQVVVTQHETMTPQKKRHLVEDAVPQAITGWFLDTGHNIENKHDERVFFSVRPPGRPLRLADGVAETWAALLENYRTVHTAEELAEHRDGDQDLVWSPHLRDTALDELRPGTLCYAVLDDNCSQVVALYPVAMSRQFYDRSPRDLAAAAGLLPATNHDELSPADRLFGWAPPVGRGDQRAATRAIRGRVRVGAVTTTSARVEPVGRTLAVLERPRPTQDLFYAARDPLGRPLEESPGYREGQGLRGRKVYPHQPSTTWGTDRSQPWLLQGDGQQPGTQSAFLADRVAEGAVFEVDLHVENLTSDELGALLCVVAGPSGTVGERVHKLGGGKPLGFGSVTIEVLHGDSDVRDTRAWLSWLALDTEAGGEVLDADRAARLAEAAWASFAARTRTAYAAYLRGFPVGSDVHYPNDPAPQQGAHADENRYAWFVANRRRETTRPRRDAFVLPELGDDTKGLALPTDPKSAL